MSFKFVLNLIKQILNQMKTQLKKTTLLLFNLFLMINTFGQNNNGIFGTENWFNNWTNFKPGFTDYKDATLILSGLITENTTLMKKKSIY